VIPMNISFALWQLPLVYLLGCLLSSAFPARAWRLADISAIAGMLAAAGGGLLMAQGVAPASSALPALLIAIVAWVIVRFSRDYLRGEPGQPRYVAALMFTLAAVMTVVVTDHLGLLLVAWVATSLGLHRLLVFYPDRVPAQVAAHKKFIASRLAEICLLIAVLLIFDALDTFRISEMTLALDLMPELTPGLNLAAVLIAVAVLLKSAQLPLHGWLMQVMEAPTPVSAFLHAGIVNLGGVVIIRLAALFSGSASAQTLLVLVGSLTALLAGLAMLTRISIKVRLAWSTCAQMGFMLMECGLGLYDLAMLHLIAHSFYKAHAFLSASGVVHRSRADELLPRPSSINSTLEPLFAAVISVLAVQGLVLMYSTFAFAAPMSIAVILILGLGCAPLLVGVRPVSPTVVAVAAMRFLGVVGLFLAWHTLFSSLLPEHHAPQAGLVVLAALVFIAFYAAQLWIATGPRGAAADRLFGLAFAGFYLDEKMTRLTFRLWPISLKRPTSTSSGSLPVTSQGVAQ